MKKKLLILGGSRYILPVIKKAHELGIYVITCDYLPNNIAHRFSDKYLNLSILDKDIVLDAAKDLKIDGIMSFACDPGVLTAAYVAEKLGLPSVGSYKSVEILQNKIKFRNFLKNNGFMVPFAKGYKNINDAFNDAGLFKYPVIVKPSDSAGSKGVSKVETKEGLEDAINNALNYSHCNEFIVEEFLKQKGFSSDSDCFSINGKMIYYSFSSQRFDNGAINPYTPSAYSWPSSISNKNQEILRNEIQRLITLLGLKTSIYNIEVRETENGNAYIMECSPRGGGNRLAEMVYKYDGVDMITNSIKAAVGMELDEFKVNTNSRNIAEVILHSDKKGIFKGIRIDDSIKNKVDEIDLWIKQGDQVNDFRGANDAIGTLVLVFDSQKELSFYLDNINKYVSIIVE